MPPRTPLEFDVSLVRSPDGRAVLEGAGLPPIRGGAPAELGGDGTVWSPEHLLLAASALCFLTTFEWFARRARLRFAGLDCQAHGTVEKTPSGLAFTAIRLGVRLAVAPGEEAHAREVVAIAKRSCLVARTLRPTTDVDLEIESSATVVSAA